MQTINHFKEMAQSIDAIYMVEASPKLRIAQKNLLCGEDAPMTESKVGYHSICKSTNLPIVWTETIKSIPGGADKTPFIVAHEFFDALPIHAFQCVSITPASSAPASPSAAKKPTQPALQWREMVVSPTPDDATHESLNTPSTQDRSGPVPDFQLTLANSSTRHSLYLPESSSRFRNIKNRVGPGALIEVCPDANLYAADFASRIGGSPAKPRTRPSGAALILDYGPGDGTVPINSLRGIKHHKRVSPFSEPGLVDLSVDVDFAGVAEAATKASEGVEVHGPVEQGVFLEGMGIRERVEVLMQACKDEESRRAVETAWKRLADRGPGGMGKVYKALAILPENEGRRRPVGFGGDVQA
jgi:SAM-dependent MidA family methyltransferase